MPLSRTNKTSLTDDELILFDALWDNDCAWWMLQQEDFGDFMLPNSHSLSDAELETMLQNLVQRELLRDYLFVYAEHADKRYYGLSPQAGSLWAQERKPVWEKYVSFYIHEERYIVESPSLETAVQYMRVMQQVDSAAPQAFVQIDKPNYRLLPWKDFSMVYELSGAAEESHRTFDWDAYLNYLDWWSDLNELQWLRG